MSKNEPRCPQTSLMRTRAPKSCQITHAFNSTCNHKLEISVNKTPRLDCIYYKHTHLCSNATARGSWRDPWNKGAIVERPVSCALHSTAHQLHKLHKCVQKRPFKWSERVNISLYTHKPLGFSKIRSCVGPVWSSKMYFIPTDALKPSVRSVYSHSPALKHLL